MNDYSSALSVIFEFHKEKDNYESGNKLELKIKLGVYLIFCLRGT